MGDSGRGGPWFPRPFGDDARKEHLHYLEQALEHEHQVDEAIEARHGAKRRWRWPWRRKSAA